jgi:N-acetylglucosamine-6-phosphate deacetylase
MGEPDLAPHLLGIHLEGPFISPEDGARGAHPRQHVRLPSCELFDRLRGLAGGHVSLLTLAPELPGAFELIRHARETGVVVSLGHHLGDREVIERACAAGATAATHLGNGIPNRLPRHPNPLFDQLDEERLWAMLISDGHHVPDAFIRVVLRVKGLERFIVVSDAAPVAGLAPGRYESLAQEVVLEESGLLWNPREGHLVGSSACLLDCVNRLAAATSLGEAELWRAAHDNPLELIGRSLDPAVSAALAEPEFRDGRFHPRGAA